MKYLNIALLMVLAGVVSASTFTEINNAQYWGKTSIPKITAAVDANFGSLAAFLADGILSQGGLAIDTDTNAFKTVSTVYYTVSGIQYSKTATTGLVFSAANTINVAESTNSAFYGAWLIEINAAGAVATKPAGGLTNQVYTTAAAALADLPAPTASKVALGNVVVSVAAGEVFTATTSGMSTNNATFTDAAIKTIP